MSEKKQWFRFIKKESFEDPFKNLDVQYVCEKLLGGVLGITNFNNNPIMEYYPGGKYSLNWYEGSNNINNNNNFIFNFDLIFLDYDNDCRKTKLF